jgi:opacity protein-like surface antigen
MKKISVLILIVALTTMCLWAGTTGAYLDNPVGARAVGMGMAQVAIANDGYAMYWNPAGLAQLPKTEINSMLTSVFGSVDQKFFSYAHRFDGFSLSVGYLTSGLSDIWQTTYSSSGGVSDTGTRFSDAASALYFSGAATCAQLQTLAGLDLLSSEMAEKLSLGMNIKWIQETLQNNKTSGLAVDLGKIYQVNDNWAIGVQWQNFISPSLKWDTPSGSVDTLAPVFKVGVGYRWQDLQLAFDADFRASQSARYFLGAEYLLLSKNNLSMTIRGGLISNGTLSTGMGLNYSDIKLDYAYTTSKESYMDATHRISLGYQFDFASPKP